MTKLGKVKRGDTFAYIAIIKDEVTDVIQPGIADKLRCQIRNSKDELLADAHIRETEIPGHYLVSVSALITSLWPIETLFLDIQYSESDVVESTETVTFRVVKDITL